MFSSLIFFAVAAAAPDASVAAPAPAANSAMSQPADPFAGRPSARISSVERIWSFRVEREGSDEILYLETTRNKWFRSELTCFGINDARDAHAMRPLDAGFGIDKFSRVAFYVLGGQTTECRLNDVVALTQDEAIERKLMRAPRAKAS